VLFNLLKNALHYLPEKPGSHITIRLHCGDNGNTLCFRDTGPDIAPQQLATLFDSFSTTGKKGDAGLGLAFCKRVMSAFGGDIRCRSVLDEYIPGGFGRGLAKPSAAGGVHMPQHYRLALVAELVTLWFERHARLDGLL
jgi:signal transduction histidine kinase